MVVSGVSEARLLEREGKCTLLIFLRTAADDCVFWFIAGCWLVGSNVVAWWDIGIL